MGVVAFRVDASLQIGVGHVMRCLALAEGLREQGTQCWFISRKHPGHLVDLIQEQGFEASVLPASDTEVEPKGDSSTPLSHHAAWLGCSWEADAEQTSSVLKRLQPEWVIVDHYGLDARWESALRAHGNNVMVIDDIADRSHDCDLLLDQNLQDPARYSALIPRRCLTLIGPRYALLRPQFATTKRSLRQRDGRVHRVLVFFGGVDLTGETLKALTAIKMLGRTDIVVDVVVGHANPYRADIEGACRSIPNVNCHQHVSDMATMMAKADLFVGAGGSSSWERCCLGLPALVMATADNQMDQSETLARAGAQLYLGPVQSVTSERLANVIRTALESPDLLVHMAQQGMALVDGQGAKRVLPYLLASTIKLRPAIPKDSAAVFSWRSDAVTRRYALNPSEFDRASHEKWFANVSSDPNRELLIAEHDEQPIGVLRYDIEAGLATTSIYLVPGLAGHGWGKCLLLAGERWLQKKRPDVQVCEAEISADNNASLALFRSMGFVPYRSTFRKVIHDVQ